MSSPAPPTAICDFLPFRRVGPFKSQSSHWGGTKNRHRRSFQRQTRRQDFDTAEIIPRCSKHFGAQQQRARRFGSSKKQWPGVGSAAAVAKAHPVGVNVDCSGQPHGRGSQLHDLRRHVSAPREQSEPGQRADGSRPAAACSLGAPLLFYCFSAQLGVGSSVGDLRGETARIGQGVCE